MHIQIVNFNLNGISEEEYRRVCDEVAPAFADVPGLISKVWLADRETNTYGGILTWDHSEAMEAFTRTELFESTGANPSFANVSSRDFGVLEGPTEVTRGLLAAPAS